MGVQIPKEPKVIGGITHDFYGTVNKEQMSEEGATLALHHTFEDKNGQIKTYTDRVENAIAELDEASGKYDIWVPHKEV